MSNILAIATALPPERSDNAAVLSAARIWLKDLPNEFHLFERFLSASHTAYRHFVVPPIDVVQQEGGEQRALRFETEAPKLALSAVEKALSQAQIAPEEIDGIISTSCSCPLIPSHDTFLFEALGFRRDIVRIPSYQYGCAGGIIGLGLAARLGYSTKNILLVCTELCSLVFQPTNHSASHLVGAAIFGDGAAAAVISSERSGGLKILAHQSYLLPNTRHIMGYDIRDTGAHLRLDKELPAYLIKTVPELTDKFLAKHSLTRKEIPWWLFHPGGSKILTCLEEVLELQGERCRWASEVLHSVGNLSSATILFVTERFLKSNVANEGDLVLLIGVGPGLTIELVLARKESPTTQ